jgi:hypothetical protein
VKVPELSVTSLEKVVLAALREPPATPETGVRMAAPEMEEARVELG